MDYLRFKKEHTFKVKLTIIAIWIFILLMAFTLFNIIYQELILNRLSAGDESIIFSTIVALFIGFYLLYGVVSKSKSSRWLVLLFFYMLLLVPFVSYLLHSIFLPNSKHFILDNFSIVSFIIYFLIIYIFSNKEIRAIYQLESKGFIKEQALLIFTASIISSIYIYFEMLPTMSQATQLIS